MARAEVTLEERLPSPLKMVTERLDDGFRAGAGQEVNDRAAEAYVCSTPRSCEELVWSEDWHLGQRNNEEQ